MTFPDYPVEPRRRASERTMYLVARVAGVAAVGALVALAAVASPRAPVSLTRSVDVKGEPAQVWAMIGAYCAIKDWHPAIGKCTEDGKRPTTRTLVTKDGAATFIELQTARDDAKQRYSYTFTSAPVPVTHYSSTFRVTAKATGVSTVTWSGAYTPDAGKEKDASDALAGIYESGLAAIQARLAK
ncbi:MAG: SRPBCC family protein [Alphaproteobacteria bacterium]